MKQASDLRWVVSVDISILCFGSISKKLLSLDCFQLRRRVNLSGREKDGLIRG